MRIVIAGGGTGGHISPAIAVAQALQRMDPHTDIQFISTPRPVDRIMYDSFGDRVHVQDPPRLDTGVVDKLLFLPRGLAELIRCRRLLRKLDPAALFATGGYSSFFPILAARSLGIPSAIHDSNSVPGRSNRLAARFAGTVLTGFRGAVKYFRSKARYTGNPVRSSLEPMPRARAREALGIPSGVPVVLFLGGSQGARALNDAAFKAPEGIFVLLQHGETDSERLKPLLSDREDIRGFAFVADPSVLYSAADIAVARAGAMTTAELTWFRLPAVYVPYPYAADDHQRLNAREMRDGGGAEMVLQGSISDLWSTVAALASDDGKLEKMKKSLKKMMPDNPAAEIAGIVRRLAEKE